MVSEIRKHYFLDKYVVISSKREKRPQDFKEEIKEDPEDNNENCPFCKGNEDMTPPTIFQIPEEDWQIRLFENKFEALNNEEKFETKKENNLLQSWKPYGRHEVLVETPDHEQKFHQYSDEQLDYYFKALKRRYKELKGKDNIEYVTIFRNVGKKAGASLKHTHTQILSSPVMLGRIQNETEASRKYWEENGSCPYCDIIQTEKDEGDRVVSESENFLVICPYASVWPYGTSIVPKRHFSELSDLNQSELNELGQEMRKLLGKYNSLFGDFSYNVMFFSFPNKEYTQFRVDIYPRLKTFAGLEYFGLFINEVAPKKAAEDLRKA